MLVVVVVLARSASAAPRLWSAPALADWTADTSRQKAPDDSESVNTGLEVFVAPNDAAEVYVMTVMDPPDMGIAPFEAGVHDNLNRTGKQRSYRSSGTAKTAIFDHVIERPDGVIVWRRYLGYDREHMLSVGVGCVGSDTVCASVLASFRVDEARFIPLVEARSRVSAGDSPDRGGSGNASSYRIGQLTGAVLLVVLFGLWYRQKNRRVI